MSDSSPALNILVITGLYNRAFDNPGLINDMTAQLSRDGHKVTVIAVDWAGDVAETEHYFEPAGTEVFFIATRRLKKRTLLRRAYRFVSASFLFHAYVKRQLRGRKFDLILTLPPFINLMVTIDWALKHFRCRSYAYVTDLFPFHHHQVGAMPGGLAFRIALAIETALLRRHDVIGTMSPANRAYLQSHYALGDKPRVEVLYLWGPADRAPPADRAMVRKDYGLPVDRPVIIFGGQLSIGRGFDEVLGAARMAAEQRPDLFFLVIGKGPLAEQIAQEAADGGNIMVKPRIPREDYLTLLAACDVGIVCTVPGVDVPTFPSKTIDMLRAGVPIAAAVESTTDYSDFIRENDIGIAVEAGSAERLLGAITEIVDHPERAGMMKVAAGETLDRVFDVRIASRTLIAQSFPERAATAPESPRIPHARSGAF